jgi:hypothetical protein
MAGRYTISTQEVDLVDREFGRWVARAAIGASVVVLMTTLAAPGGRAAMAGSTAGSQRMVMAPGCHVLAPGKYDDVSAFCLDQSRAPPASGAILANAPPTLGAAVLKVEGGPPIALQSALARHMIQFEGLGDDLHVRIRNLTDKRLEICIDAPTVVTENGDSYTGDLTKAYGQIVRILEPSAGDAGRGGESKSAAERDARAKTQEQLWSAVNAADQAEAKEPGRTVLPGPLDSSGESAPAWYFPNKSKCTGGTTSVEVCTGQ